MKKFLTELLIFSSIVFFISCLLNRLMKEYNDEPAHYALQFNEISAHEVNTNAIVIGSSHASHSIRPSFLDTENYKFYNFALNGGNPKYYYHWYNLIFKANYPKPEYCIYAVDWFLFNVHWLWRNVEQDSEYFPAEVFRQTLTSADDFNKKLLIMNRLPFLKYKEAADLDKALRREKGDVRFPVNKYENGYISYQLPFDPLVLQHPPLKENAEIFDFQKEYFEKLILLFQQEGIQLIFVFAPEYNISPEEYDSLESLKVIREIAEKYEIEVLNYNLENRTAINEEKEYFTDWGHMNYKGSEVFSKLLHNDLEEIMR